MSEKQDHLSWSQFKTYSTCGERYRLRYELGIKGQRSGAMVAGSAIHKAIEWCEQENLPDTFASADAFQETMCRQIAEQQFLDTFKAMIEEAGGPEALPWAGRKSKEFPRGEDMLWWSRSGPMMMRRYLEIRKADIERGYRIFDGIVERRLMATLPSGSHVKMVVDAAILIDSDGIPALRDWKTGSGENDRMQLAVYAWGVGQLMGIHPQRGEFGLLRQVDQSKRLDSYDLAPFSIQVPDFFERLEHGIKSKTFLLVPNRFCGTCEVKEHCSYGSALPENVAEKVPAKTAQ